MAGRRGHDEVGRWANRRWLGLTGAKRQPGSSVSIGLRNRGPIREPERRSCNVPKRPRTQRRGDNVLGSTVYGGWQFQQVVVVSLSGARDAWCGMPTAHYASHPNHRHMDRGVQARRRLASTQARRRASASSRDRAGERERAGELL
ncbi:hypothetical protein K504DRAFT_450616 [Pleomassaria siparia CBS 279.74]|uniref:Uncharacterized protein n=1 Tax=Pleomassaria siparia CBS 279.74 TaxID=1314801 RepID=A0A6G1KNV1_9PLEO|nr:hypothetical protein K504DRAFT_450616 [Pleomassaria siparia CBS 279.74]